MAIGRFGPYAKMEKDGEVITTSLPFDMDPSDLTAGKLEELIQRSSEEDKPLGIDEDSGLPVLCIIRTIWALCTTG